MRIWRPRYASLRVGMLIYKYWYANRGLRYANIQVGYVNVCVGMPIYTHWYMPICVSVCQRIWVGMSIHAVWYANICNRYVSLSVGISIHSIYVTVCQSIGTGILSYRYAMHHNIDCVCNYMVGMPIYICTGMPIYICRYVNICVSVCQSII